MRNFINTLFKRIENQIAKEGYGIKYQCLSPTPDAPYF